MALAPPAEPRRLSTKPQEIVEQRYRTCCDCCHIKVGTVFLGLLEAVVAFALLFTLVQQLLWKTRHEALCHSSPLRDCLIFKFSHFNITLIFDWIIAFLLIFVLLSVILMFCGIMSDTSSLLFPHLFIQAAFLLFSVGYFVVYAWSYVYGDLYTHNRVFTVQALIERMWLASLLLIIAAFQIYLFFAVAKCTIYLAKIHDSRRQRETAFFRMSERVRIAKENGLWRNNGVGGFMQYTMQYDEDAQANKKKTPKEGHVQWNMEPRVVVLDEEDEKSRVEQTLQEKRPEEYEKAAPRLKRLESDRSVDGRTSKGETEGKGGRERHHHHHKRRDDAGEPRRKSSTEKTRPSISATVTATDSPSGHRTSSSSSPEKASGSGGEGKGEESKGEVKIERGKGRRDSINKEKEATGECVAAPSTTPTRAGRPLRKLKSMDSAEQMDLPAAETHRSKGRRRSSDAVDIAEGGTHRHRHHHRERQYITQDSKHTFIQTSKSLLSFQK